MPATPMIAGLEFGNAWMLGWLAAAALPWLVNLWAKNRYDETPWAAIALLREALQRESQRIRRQNWLLLATRTAVVALAALAVTRPAWRGADAGPLARSAVHSVVVVDCSLSMATRKEGRSRLDRAIEHAHDILAQSAVGDAYSVLAWGATVDEPLGRPVQSAGQAQAALESIRQQAAVADLAAALSAIERTIARGKELYPAVSAAEVVWLTDCGESTWGPLVDDSSHDRALSAAWRRLSEQAELVFPLQVDAARENVAVVDVRLEPGVAMAGDEQAAVVATVRAFGAAASERDVELVRDGVVVARQNVRLAADKPAAPVRFPVASLAAGEQTWEVRLVESSPADQAADELGEDDRRWLAARIPSALRIACIAGVSGAADDVARALRAGPGGAAPRLEAVILAADELEQLDFDRCGAIILCDVGDVSERSASLLRRYVTSGGGLACLLGRRTKPGDWNERLGPDADGGPLLPMRIGDNSVAGDWRWNPQDFSSPILAPFAGHERAGLSSIRIQRRWPLSAWDEAAHPSHRCEVVATTNDGDPLLVAADFGLGRSAVLATDPALRSGERSDAEREPWSSLAVSPAFVPLMRLLVEDLGSSRREAHNVIAGQPLVATAPAATPLAELVWRSPQGTAAVETTKANDGAPTQLRFTETRDAGAYALESRPARSRERFARSFAVNVDPRESDPGLVEPSSILALSRLSQPADTPAEVASGRAATAAGARSLAFPLALAALVACLLERLLVVRHTRGAS